MSIKDEIKNWWCDLFHRKKYWVDDGRDLYFCRKCGNHGNTPNFIDNTVDEMLGNKK